MGVKNNLQANAKKPTFQSFIKAPAVLSNISSTLGSESKQKTFVASVISAVSTNPALQECDGASIVSAALLGESLQLSPSPQLGHYYMVPFNNKEKGKVATFQLGYKGYIQLAIRSGQYKKINVLDIKEGELINYNPLYEELEVNIIEDELERENAKTIGYYAMFELVNGFRKAIYWSKEKMETHAMKYSQGYKAKKGYTFWEKDFDGMAFKTMLRQLISKWGIMSIELQSAYENDMTFKEDLDTQPKYFDTDPIEAVVEETIVDDVPKQEVKPETNINEEFNNDF